MIDASKGRALWGELHAVGRREKINLAQQKAFFAAWLMKVETLLTCQSCFRKLSFFVSKWPVDYGEGFHVWGICLHDYVNKELGRDLFHPEISIALLTRRGIIQ